MGVRCFVRPAVWVVLAFGAGLSGCGGTSHGATIPEGATEPPDAEAFTADFVLAEPAPPFAYLYEGDLLACSECHEEPEEADLERRELTGEHTSIVFRHDEAQRWCLDCHDAENRDMLRLANGTLVKPGESHRLCGQCHGDKYRDWRAGVHGRRTGLWNGEKQYRLCVHCHDPHAPRFAPLVPEAPPRRPESLMSEVVR